MARRFPSNQYQLLRALADREAPCATEELVSALGVDQSLVAAAAVPLEESGLVETTETSFVEIRLTDDGRAAAAADTPLIERRMAQALAGAGTPMSTPELAAAIGVNPGEVGKALRFVTSKGWARRDGKALRFVEDADLGQTRDEALLAGALAAGDEPLRLHDHDPNRAAYEPALKDLRARKFVKTKDRKRRQLALTDAGRALLTEGVEEAREATALTEQMLLDGSWRDVSFRSYDVDLDVAPVHPARIHPLRRVLEETRRAFLNLGFTEIRGPYVESAFWDFDALFQPQDHPAREMQDTFYCQRPGKFDLPEGDLVDRIRETHETGGDTGSTGWRYKWSAERARQVVLRTHTTAVTVSHCHDNPQAPQKLFCVGRVFRRETIDYKHLPEFHQVEGIIVDPAGSLSSLLGILAEFYRLMGFDEVKFRPDFFPYTEPSVGVFVRMPGRRDWFELGGSGIFRPEVTRPAGVNVPVLAWGLGLERLAMVRYGVKDIRELYMSHQDWLKEAALCR